MRLRKILSSSFVLGALFLNSGAFAGRLNQYFHGDGFSDEWTTRASNYATASFFEIDDFPKASEKTRENYFLPRGDVALDCLAISLCINQPFGNFLESGDSGPHNWIKAGRSADFLMNQSAVVAQWSPDVKQRKPQMVEKHNGRSVAWFIKVGANREISDLQVEAIRRVLAFRHLHLTYGADHHELRGSAEAGTVANMDAVRAALGLRKLPGTTAAK